MNMYGKIKRLTALVLAFLCLAGTPMESWAATKPMNSISIRITSKLKAGNKLPPIEIGSGSAPDDGIMVTQKGSHFTVISATWVDSTATETVAADEPRMKLVLEPEDVSEYYFLANYKASNVKVSGGSFVSARREGDNLVVTVKVNPIRGQYDSPRDAYWNEKNLGEARWEKPENDSGYYEVQLLRDNKNVFKVNKTSSTSYNFYPYMTQTGNYSFKIRTIPGTDFQKSHAKQSEWLESGQLSITERYVSDGKGQQNSKSTAVKGTEDAVGWIKQGTEWLYRFPSGSYKTNGWERINDKWYYFDNTGLMLKGWQTIGGYQYYLHGNGEMALGWTRIDGKWYYFRPEKEGIYPEGSMFSSGWRVVAGYYYYFNQDGSIFTGWLKENDNWYYLNTLDNGLQGAMFTGWIRRDEKTYFADSNGEMVEGWYQIDGQWHYFYPGSGEMAYNTEIDGFYLDADGVWKQ